MSGTDAKFDTILPRPSYPRHAHNTMSEFIDTASNSTQCPRPMVPPPQHADDFHYIQDDLVLPIGSGNSIPDVSVNYSLSSSGLQYPTDLVFHSHNVSFTNLTSDHFIPFGNPGAIGAAHYNFSTDPALGWSVVDISPQAPIHPDPSTPLPSRPQSVICPLGSINYFSGNGFKHNEIEEEVDANLVREPEHTNYHADASILPSRVNSQASPGTKTPYSRKRSWSQAPTPPPPSPIGPRSGYGTRSKSTIRSINTNKAAKLASSTQTSAGKCSIHLPASTLSKLQGLATDTPSFGGPLISSPPLHVFQQPMSANDGGSDGTVASQTPSGSGGGPRQVHNRVEKQYRTRLNAQFDRLLAVLPSDLNNQEDEDGRFGAGADLAATWRKNTSSVSRASDKSISKGEVLELATRRIKTLEREKRELQLRQDELLQNLEMMTGGSAPAQGQVQGQGQGQGPPF